MPALFFIGFVILFPYSQYNRYGALDAKVASKSSFPSLAFQAVAGPTHDFHTPFEWSSTNLADVPVFRPIDKFDFQPRNHTWAMNGAVA